MRSAQKKQLHRAVGTGVEETTYREQEQRANAPIVRNPRLQNTVRVQVIGLRRSVLKRFEDGDG